MSPSTKSFFAFVGLAILVLIRRFYTLGEDHTTLSNINISRTLTVERWEIPRPSLEFQKGESLVRLNYGTMENSEDAPNKEDGSSYVLPLVTLWTKECRSGGGIEIKPKANDEQGALTVEKNPDYSIAAVSIDMDRLWRDFGDELSANTTAIETRDSISFCVRYALSARTYIASDEANPVEVNFVESVVTTNRAIVDDRKEQQDPEVISVSISHQQLGYQHHPNFDENFTIEAFLCSETGESSPTRVTFSQGSAVTLCVQPSMKDGSIIISSIREFTWKKITGDGYDSVATSQQAVKDGAPSDFLTLYKGCGNGDTIHCELTTLLLAKFYSGSDGKLGGTGIASLKFGAPRENIRRVPRKMKVVQFSVKTKETNATSTQRT